MDAAVVSDVEWHSAHPTLLNKLLPFGAADACGAGCGGADNRAKIAKFTTSDDMVDAVPNGRRVFGSRSTVESSGVALKTQPGTAERSFGNISFETPCSTLYASPANTSSDLFCAFQPNR